MRILLVRHAFAGIRGTWPGDDLDRELSDVGRVQADAIAEQWADSGVGAVLSSRAARCMETVAPLADRLGLEVQEHAQLLEGAAPPATLDWLESLHEAPVVVACSHGDVIGGIIDRLQDRGTPLGGVVDWPKGSTWELELEDGLIMRGCLHAPPDVSEA